MGTRNLTEVRVDGKVKVAQYGQWDGYPTGQGQTIADFLKTVDLDEFKEQVRKLGKYTAADIKQAYADAGADVNSEWVNMEVSDRKNGAHPALNRDYGAGVLQLIHDGVVTKVNLNEDFKNDGLFCEYYYEINLDDETVSVNGGKKYTFAQWRRKGLMKKLEECD